MIIIILFLLYAPKVNELIIINILFFRRTGLGNDTSPELVEYEVVSRMTTNLDQSPCGCMTPMRPLPQPSISFNSPSCSLHRSSMSSLQPLQRIDGAAAGDNAPIYSTPSTCRASLARMQSVAPPFGALNSGSNQGPIMGTLQTQYPGTYRCVF